MELALELGGSSSSPKSLDDFDKFIALRMDVRSCTKHPMTHYVSYHALSSSFDSFFISLSSILAPCSVFDSETLLQPRWRVAMEEEMSALEKNHTWELVDLPKRNIPIGLK